MIRLESRGRGRRSTDRLALVFGAWIAAAGALSGEMTLVSRSAAGPVAVGAASAIFGLSADGRYLAFSSEATSLVAGGIDTAATLDAFLWDRETAIVTLVSRAAGTATTAANGASEALQVSADGRYVLFLSVATNLVAGQIDANGAEDLFLYDRQTEAVTLLSHAAGSATTTANGAVEIGMISADGAIVAFSTSATNQVAGVTDTNGLNDLFAWERSSGQTTLASHASGSATTAANGASSPTFVAADSDTVLFNSTATNLIAGITDANGVADAFIRRVQRGTTALVSRSGASASTTGADESNALSISADGRYVLFNSDADDLVAGGTDANQSTDVFLWDRDAAAVNLVSHTAGSATTTPDGNSFAYWSALSADGRYAAFLSSGVDLVAGQLDQADSSDVFLWDRDDGSLRLVSHVAGSPTTAVDHLTFPAHISADGETVIFNSYEDADELVPGVADPLTVVSDVFLWRRGFETLRLASYSATSATPAVGDSDSYGIALSSDGRYVAIDSFASDLVAGVSDPPESEDLFLWRDPAIFLDGFGTGTPERWSATSP